MYSVALIKIIDRLGLTATAKWIKKQLAHLRLWPKAGFGYSHRNRAYKLLSGRGLEVGALHIPAYVPASCKMEYCDAISELEAAQLFPEIAASSFVKVAYLVNLDTERLRAKVKPPYDFVIMNHVIEHVANPIAVLLQLFEVVKPGGAVIISAPDKYFTFDKARDLTPFKHLIDEYRREISVVADDHYLDFLGGISPNLLNSGNEEQLALALQSARRRREHAHVWSSISFLEFLNDVVKHFELDVVVDFASEAKDNNFECFAVLRTRGVEKHAQKTY